MARAVDIETPKLGVKQAQVVEWLVERGTEVEEGQKLVELTPHDVPQGIPAAAVKAPAEGTLVSMDVGEGDIVETGDLLGVVIVDDDEEKEASTTTQSNRPSRGYGSSETQQDRERCVYCGEPGSIVMLSFRDVLLEFQEMKRLTGYEGRIDRGEYSANNKICSPQCAFYVWSDLLLYNGYEDDARAFKRAGDGMERKKYRTRERVESFCQHIQELTVTASEARLQARQEDRRCFIATAAYGTSLSDDVNALRRWRDESLRSSPVGRLFIALYYKVSPPIADLIESRPTLRRLTRVLLKPIVARARSSYGSGEHDSD